MTRKLQVYQSSDITVTYDPNICVHAGVCVRGLHAVFDTSRADWIRPDAAPAAEVAELVARCPSGALQAIRPGIPPGRPTGSGDAVTVSIVADGPARIRGPVRLELPSGAQSDRTSFAICRCGGTREPPFCDGSHGPAGFRSRP